MDSESTPIVKLIAGAVGLVVVCFCVGFFLLGGRSGGAATTVVERPDATPSPLAVEGPDSPRLSVIETTERKPTAPPGLRVSTALPAEEATPAPRPTPDAAAKAPIAKTDTSEGVAAPAAGEKPSGKPKKPAPGDESLRLPAPEETAPTPAPDAAEEAKPADNGAGTLYRVRVKNAFGSHDDADQLASELKGRGFAASVMPAGKGKFQVQIGAYRDKKRAEEKQRELEKNNYDTRISDKEDDEKPDEEKAAKKDDGEKKKSGDD